MNSNLPVWRSMLFVPVTQRRFVEGAARRGADAIILDLEDAVAASEKDRARTLVPEAAEIVSRGGADVVVRINRPVRMTVRDLEAVIGPGVQAIALPKAESPEHVQLVAEMIDEIEAERGMEIGTTKMLAMVDNETKIVPGHGPLGNKADLRKFRDMLVTARVRVQKLKASGKSLEQAIAAKPLADLDPVWGKGVLTSDAFVHVVYTTL